MILRRRTINPETVRDARFGGAGIWPNGSGNIRERSLAGFLSEDFFHVLFEDGSRRPDTGTVGSVQEPVHFPCFFGGAEFTGFLYLSARFFRCSSGPGAGDSRIAAPAGHGRTGFFLFQLPDKIQEYFLNFGMNHLLEPAVILTGDCQHTLTTTAERYKDFHLVYQLIYIARQYYSAVR
ncbi:hypothetical protein [Methanoregula sp. PtaU1.Bin006]|uniref:hypothetical protein n=1 Tax=Methanoregula sp. PtaU1.Bin006 TaxID=1811681 RepID=UPI0025E9F00E|nr:hypothetical protein [Methanoregula sp. PtaU1.Bin006]